MTPLDPLFEKLDLAVSEERLTVSAANHIREWLTADRYQAYVPQIAAHIEESRWQALDDAFWTVIPFGTGGRRGRMYPIGCNVINDRTIGESAQGLADYVKSQVPDGQALSCAIAYDTRHNSVAFSRLCAEVMVANGFRVFYLDEHRSTPELSFLVRFKGCACGIMVTASHNPPSDNAVKAYWSTGGQILPPHDKAVIDRVMSVDEIQRIDFDTALADGHIELCRDEVDVAFYDAVVAQAFPGARDLKLIYSPLHGVGATAVCPVLAADGFTDVEVFAPHAEPSGDFPNVPGHVSNPENVAVFDEMIARGKTVGADLILATDPDCDRLGCAAPRSRDPQGDWQVFSGNQIAALLADFVLEQRKAAGTLTDQHYLVKTLVTTELVRRIGASYGVETVGNLLVGFKWIGGAMDERGADRFLLGAEESHGYLVGTHARDKDAAVAAMLMAEMAAACKADGQTLSERLEALYWQHGYHAECLATTTMTGSEGMAQMKALMAAFRNRPPRELAGIAVAGIRDFASGEILQHDGTRTPFDGPRGDMVMVDLETPGNYVAVRPSGTEPKVKFYAFAYTPAEQISLLEQVQQQTDAQLKQLIQDLEAFAQDARA